MYMYIHMFECVPFISYRACRYWHSFCLCTKILYKQYSGSILKDCCDQL